MTFTINESLQVENSALRAELRKCKEQSEHQKKALQNFLIATQNCPKCSEKYNRLMEESNV